MSTPVLLRAALAAVRKLAPGLRGRHLDIGAGHGQLIDLFRAEFRVHSEACDYTPALMRSAFVKVKVADLNVDALPYADGSFEAVTGTEVVEHLENYRHLTREAFRVLKPGGVLVLTTPNTLNLKSRVRYLLFGFFNLFGPLHIRDSRRYSTGGHIGPVSAFYLAHALAGAGFEAIDITIDRRQRTSVAWLSLLGLPIWLGSALAMRRERKRYGTIDAHNEPFVRRMNQLDMLCGRTIVIGCRKKSSPDPVGQPLAGPAPGSFEAAVAATVSVAAGARAGGDRDQPGALRLAAAIREIQAAFDQMQAAYAEVVFDEWAIISGGGHGGVCSYHGPRPEIFREALLLDVELLRKASAGKELTAGDIEFTPSADGRRHDALMKLGTTSYLVCNHTKKTIDQLRSGARWGEAQEIFLKLSERFRANPLMD